MRSVLLLAALSHAVVGFIKPRNFIFIVPDGMAPASETLARAYQAFLNGNSDPEAPVIDALPIDKLPAGIVRTHSADNLVTDSAAAGTAFAAGYKTLNGALGVDKDGLPIGTVMEAAKLAGFKTGLVVTSIINHATPAAFSSHVLDRDAYAAVASQQIGYSHPLNISVDIMLGGGACYFRPSSDPDSCRDDDVDLFAYAESQGYYIAQDRAGFEGLEQGKGAVDLPYLGLFSNDTDLAYDVDRLRQAESDRQPSLSEMTETALSSLERATACRGDPRKGEKAGYFIMIESSRIDHAAHAHDAAAHLGDVLEYNKVVELVMQWIDAHPDTAMISVADHETGGLTLPGGYDPRPITNSTQSVEFLSNLFEEYDGDDVAGFITEEILPRYGVWDANSTLVEALLESEDFDQTLADLLNERTGQAWSTGGHSGVDTTVYTYANGRMGEQLRLDLAGSHDNTELPWYIAQCLGLDLEAVTDQLRALGTGWIP